MRAALMQSPALLPRNMSGKRQLEHSDYDGGASKRAHHEDRAEDMEFSSEEEGALGT